LPAEAASLTSAKSRPQGVPACCSGPHREMVARYLQAVADPRHVVCDPEAPYWGGRVEEHSLVPMGETRLGRIGFDEWFRRSQAAT